LLSFVVSLWILQETRSISGSVVGLVSVCARKCPSLSDRQAVIVLRWSISAGIFSCEQVMEGSLAGAPFWRLLKGQEQETAMLWDITEGPGVAQAGCHISWRSYKFSYLLQY